MSVPSGSVAPAHAHWVINDFFNNDPERLTTWHGTPADLGVRPCKTPAGSCLGYLGVRQTWQNCPSSVGRKCSGGAIFGAMWYSYVIAIIVGISIVLGVRFWNRRGRK